MVTNVKPWDNRDTFTVTERIDRLEIEDVGIKLSVLFEQKVAEVSIADDRGGGGGYVLTYKHPDRRKADRRGAVIPDPHLDAPDAA